MNIEQAKDMVAKYQMLVNEHQAEVEKRGAQGKLVSDAADEIKNAVQHYGAIGMIVLQVAADRAILDFYTAELQKLEAAQIVNN